MIYLFLCFKFICDQRKNDSNDAHPTTHRERNSFSKRQKTTHFNCHVSFMAQRRTIIWHHHNDNCPLYSDDLNGPHSFSITIMIPWTFGFTRMRLFVAIGSSDEIAIWTIFGANALNRISRTCSVGHRIKWVVCLWKANWLLVLTVLKRIHKLFAAKQISCHFICSRMKILACWAVTIILFATFYE